MGAYIIYYIILFDLKKTILFYIPGLSDALHLSTNSGVPYKCHFLHLMEMSVSRERELITSNASDIALGIATRAVSLQ